MRLAIFLTALLFLSSCLEPGNNSYYIRTTGKVPIIQTDIPDSVIVNQFSELKARAEEENACWSNLNFVLTKRSDFEYSLEAFGVFESDGNCPTLKVTADTAIAFKPVKAGLYRFHVSKNPEETEIDTMIVSPEI